MLSFNLNDQYHVPVNSSNCNDITCKTVYTFVTARREAIKASLEQLECFCQLFLVIGRFCVIDVAISLEFWQHCYDDYDAHDEREEDQWRQNAPHRPQ